MCGKINYGTTHTIFIIVSRALSTRFLPNNLPFIQLEVVTQNNTRCLLIDIWYSGKQCLRAHGLSKTRQAHDVYDERTGITDYMNKLVLAIRVKINAVIIKPVIKLPVLSLWPAQILGYIMHTPTRVIIKLLNYNIPPKLTRPTCMALNKSNGRHTLNV